MIIYNEDEELIPTIRIPNVEEGGCEKKRKHPTGQTLTKENEDFLRSLGLNPKTSRIRRKEDKVGH